MRRFNQRPLFALLLATVTSGFCASCITNQQGQQEQYDDYEQDGRGEQGAHAPGLAEGDADFNDINELSQQTNLAEDNGIGIGANSDQLPLGETGELNSLNELSNELGDLGNNEQITDDPLQTATGLVPEGIKFSPTATESAAIPDPATDPGARVVRFVQHEGLQVLDQPGSSGSSVATLAPGDPLVVKIQGEWAEIAQGRYVPVTALSESLVPRKLEAQDWSPAP